MALTRQPRFVQTDLKEYVKIVNADTSTLKTLVTAPTDGCVIYKINCVSDETSTARDISLWITISSVDYLLTTISLLANSGFTNAATTIDMLSHSQFANNLPIDANGNRYLPLKSGEVLKVKSGTTVTSGKTLYFTAIGANF